MTLSELKILITDNAVNLCGDVTIVDGYVEFKIDEIAMYEVRAFIDGDMILELSRVGDDNWERNDYTVDAYAKFLRAEAEDSMQ